MKYGISIANYGVSETPMAYAHLAYEAENAGWEGFFLWDHIVLGAGRPNHDPWIILAAIACNTEKIRLGTVITPLPRRRPQKVARETASLDRLSEGRLVLGVGLGEPDFEYTAFGETYDKGVRAKMLDESLEIITRLWSGKVCNFDGKYLKALGVTFQPTPVQKPRIPIWVGGKWPRKGAFRRAAKYDGAAPVGAAGPKQFAEMMEYVKSYRKRSGHYDWICYNPYLSTQKRRDVATEYKDIGATWFLESWGSFDLKKQLPRLKRGPPDV
jgi:alkanesulfonate monooxygenase SsuD/methylene tetrahydromethanopterin reductase-like flavin-dependent oxidoreductase (luciferase family)